MLGWLLTSRIGRALAWAGALIIAFVTFGAFKEREGRKQAETDMEESDRENANDIRDRVDRNLPDRLREMEGRGFRD